MKYAHLADLHLGSWRDPKMRDLSTRAFLQAIDICIQEQVDFMLFAGDLFNTSLPAIDILKIVTQKLKQLHDLAIPVYVIAGSHDFSASGKTMIGVLEQAGLLINVCRGKVNQETKGLELKFTQDTKTGAKITGIIGRKGQLDQTYYETLHTQHLESEQGYKIFMFHTTVTELLNADLAMIESQPLSVFPKGFDYYAGGHIHHPAKVSQEGYKLATYPGALYPNSFAEIEKFGNGGFYLIITNGQEQLLDFKECHVAEHQGVVLDCTKKSPEVIAYEILSHFENKDLTNCVITIRLRGTLAQGRVSDIAFKDIFAKLYEQGAYFVMKNTVKLQSVGFEQISIASSDPVIVEQEIINEHVGQQQIFDVEVEKELCKSLLESLHESKKEGETNSDFEERIKSQIKAIVER